MLLVGYGVDGDKFWKIKNSWSEKWGEDGYVRLLRADSDETGMCAVAADASYPKVPSYIE